MSANPLAFPHSHVVYSDGQPSCGDSDYDDGMSLRDYFAAVALQGLIACPAVTTKTDSFFKLSEWAYRYADFMLEARNK